MEVFCSSFRGCFSEKKDVELEYRCNDCKECLLQKNGKMHRSIIKTKNDTEVLASFLKGNASVRRNAVAYAPVDVIAKL